jgi:probable addiction module antidote protein
MKKKSVKLRDYEDFMKEELLDMELVKLYLSEAIRDKNPLIFKQCLLRVIKAHGGVQEMADSLDITRQTIYNNFSTSGNPSFQNVTSILRITGFELDIRSF